MKITDPNLNTVETSFRTKQVPCIQYLVKNGYVKKLLLLFFLNMIKNEYSSTYSCDMHISYMCKRLKKFGHIIVYVCLYVINFVCKH